MFGFGGDKEKKVSSAARMEIGFLGKLESRPDFLKYCSEFREVATLDMCLRDWMLMQNALTQQSSTKRSAIGFLMVGGHDRQGLSGYLFPSQDSHGRRYPFFYFVRCSDVDLYFKPASLFYGSSRIFEQADPELSWPLELPGEPALEKLKSQHLLTQLPTGKQLMSGSMSVMTEMTFEQWLTAMVGADIQTQKMALAGWRNQIQYYFEKNFNVDLKLPLGASELAPYSMLFWLHLLSGLVRPVQWRPDIIWLLNEQSSLLNILAKPITASRLEQLVSAYSVKDEYSPIQASGFGQSLKWAEQLLSHRQRLLLDVAISWSQMV
ncbi:TagF domain-containing protein [Gynuella sunshinyii]|uniref:Uncharacterized protein n=1 Tax=Gynuella sunshinyii YC6258 TaxID=1445510 RepID=A0A0C5VHU7_9GAMM|nr:TagF domain-containing protein [Gynuella sunshinyii]AJQ93821.1 hypothetical protein YC6258_01777 [Gynuella sunshinyii YC6258]